MSGALQRVVDALETRDCIPKGNAEKGYQALCPAHADRNPSLGIKETADGTVLVRCYADCETADILAVLGLEFSDLFADGPGVRSEIVATYDYTDEHGELLYQVCRFLPKDFRQRRPDGAGGWEWRLGNVRRVLYRLPAVLAARDAGRWVSVVEGERDVHALERIAAVATTMPGGVGKWRPEYTETLRGAKVAVITDNDEPGRKHALQVADALDGIAAKVKLYEPVDAKDVSEHLAAGRTLKDLRPFDGTSALTSTGTRKGVISARDFCARPAPDKSLQILGPLLWRDTRLSTGAGTGEGKTTITVQMIRAVVCKEEFLGWHGTGGRALVVDVEQGEETVKQRLREAGLEGERNVDLLHEPDGLSLDESPEDIAYVEDVLKAGGYDVVAFDPLYQLYAGDPNEEARAKRIMSLIDGWARRYHFATIVPMHRRKPHPAAGLNSFTINDISGNGVYTRNSEIVLGLQHVSSGYARLHFFKDRIGSLPPVGTWWGLLFDKDSGQFYRDPNDSANKPAAKKRLGALLKDTPGLTLLEIARTLEVGPDTVRKALSKLGAHPDDPNAPAELRRWALEPWPERQTSLLSIEDGRTG